MTNAWMTVKVATKHTEALDVVSLDLVAVEGTELPAFSAGAHIDIEIEPGLVRQYSLCNNPLERSRYQIAVLRDERSRGGSVSLHENVEAGQLIRISTPRNHFSLEPTAERTVLIAGGIGVTPILCMAESLTQSRGAFEMHYCVRSQERCAFYRRIQDAPYRDRVHLYFNDRPETPRFDIKALLARTDPRAHLYVCGPAGFIDHVLDSAREAGFAEAQLHREFFAAQSRPSASPEDAFQIRLQRSGKTLEVPADMTIAQVLAQHDVAFELSCEQGVCGTCLTRLLEGEADHRDFFLTTAEQTANDQIAICCSRARSPLLVLDI